MVDRKGKNSMDLTMELLAWTSSIAQLMYRYARERSPS